MYRVQLQCNGCANCVTFEFRPAAINHAKDPGRAFVNIAKKAAENGWIERSEVNICAACAAKETVNVDAVETRCTKDSRPSA